MSAPDDEALIEAFARGDASAYRAFAERHLSAILRYATRLLGDASDAQDVTQETFLRAFQHASSYEAKGHRPTTWLYRIAHNLCIDRLRRRKRTDADAVDQLASQDRPSLELERAQLSAAVASALARLPERQRAALVLQHYEGLSHAEAAEVLGCGVHALESLIARARRTLREELQRIYEDLDPARAPL